MPEINSAWFAGPKAENADWFTDLLQKVAWDYYFWRRNYFPGDGAVIGSSDRRPQEDFRDNFEDRLFELLGKLKGDCPFHSPRYAGHMIAEQTLPSIPGYFAAMLYNPNNVTSESAPVTVQMELEAAQIIASMLGHGPDGWAHLCGGGTAANIEALWVARTMLYLPYLVADLKKHLGQSDQPNLHQSPQDCLLELENIFLNSGTPEATIRQWIAKSPANIAQFGFSAVERHFNLRPVLIVPESHHYCFDKAMDLLGLGRESLIRVRVNADFRMDVSHLAEILEQCEAENRSVLAVVAVMGTTEEGAIDPLEKIVELRKSREISGKRSFWLHADAAYGGYLRSMILPERIGLGHSDVTTQINGLPEKIQLQLPEGTACDSLAAMGDCDSITIDPHKLGYVPYPGGAISYKSARVKPIVKQTAPYLEDNRASYSADITSGQIGMFSLEGSRPGAMAAGVWLSHKSIPLDTSGHGILMRETIRNACLLHALLCAKKSNSVEAVPLCTPGSNIVCYAFRAKGSMDLKSINRLNHAIYERMSINSADQESIHSKSFFVSRTTLAPNQYSVEATREFLSKLGVTEAEFAESGVFLLRSVLMNPWYELAAQKGNAVLEQLVDYLFEKADALLEPMRAK